MPDYKELCNSVVEISKKVEKELLLMADKGFSVDKKGYNDFVTEADKKAEEIFVAELRKILPEASFIAEEGSAQNLDTEFKWVIDPIDGTTNFVQSLPTWCSSVALLRNNEIVVGVVNIPKLQECFYAIKDEGAFLNGTKISVSRQKLEDELIATGFPYQKRENHAKHMDMMSHLIYATKGVRRLGSAAIDLAFVASGRFGAYYEIGLNPWDVAAGILLVEEAGGKVSEYNKVGNPLFNKQIVAANPNIHEDILALIKEFELV